MDLMRFILIVQEFRNTAIGRDALFSDTTGSQNTATGVLALNGNTTGNHNTANGVSALMANTIGDDNTANGYTSLFCQRVGQQWSGCWFESQFNANNTTTDWDNTNTS